MDVTLPDGTTVRAVSIHDRRESDPERDFGLYPRAVPWVRGHYDPLAVEPDEQETWVQWFTEQPAPR